MPEPKYQMYFDYRPDIRPALDFVEGVAYITLPMDIDIPIKKKVKGEEQEVGKRKARRPVTITSEKKYFHTTEEAFMKRGLCLMGAVAVPRRRWSLDSIHDFLTGEIKKEPSFWGTFGAIRQRYKHYMDLESESAYSLASLWVIGTYFFPLFDAYPYAYFGGMRETGKTKMLTLTQQMAFNSISSGNISTSSVFRLIEGSRTTLLVDEAEKLGITDRGQEFKNILNASYKPGNPVFRAEKTTKEQFIVTSFDAYSPKMLANIAGLEDVLQSRVIPFHLKRTLNLEIANREIDTREETWEYIRNGLYLLVMLKWKEVKYAYSQAEPVEGIKARDWEIWRPIIAMAKVCNNTGALEKEMVELGRIKSKEKLKVAAVESGDAVLIRILLNLVDKPDFYQNKEIKSLMVDHYGEPYKWLNGKWVGGAIRRVFGEIEARSRGTGAVYYLTPEMVAEAAQRNQVDITESEVSGGSEGKTNNIDMEV